MFSSTFCRKVFSIYMVIIYRGKESNSKMCCSYRTNIMLILIYSVHINCAILKSSNYYYKFHCKLWRTENAIVRTPHFTVDSSTTRSVYSDHPLLQTRRK